MSLFRVTATSLNLRSKPVVTPATKLVALPHGQVVKKLEALPGSDWWRVSTTINGDVEGYVNSTFLEPIKDFVAPVAANEIVAVHLTPRNKIARDATSGRAFPLNEAGQPTRSATTSNKKVTELHNIINWLKVDESPRYLRKASETYCNIYAYDYAYLAGVYLPRVWWTSKAIALLAAGKKVIPEYDKTVLELNANSLHNWFAEFGDDFGWRRSFDINEMQTSANNGEVCIISARRKELNRPGHICAVVPETDTHTAMRKNGVVITPVQSNAGATNFRYGGRVWWTSENFSSFSFWIHP